MSTNCLVTKLKETVDNGSLKKLGVLNVSINNESQATVRIRTSTTLTFTDTGGTFSDGTTEKTINSGDGGIILSPGSHMLEIKPKYNITMLNISGVTNSVTDINDLEYVTGLLTLNVEGSQAVGDIGCLEKLTNLQNLQIGAEQQYIKGDISVVSNFTSLTIFTGCKSLKGNINSFAACASLGILIFNRNYNIVGNISSIKQLPFTRLNLSESINIEGTVEEFVAGQRLISGRESYDAGTNFSFAGTQVTFNGSRIPLSPMSLSWDATTITCNGVTITA